MEKWKTVETVNLLTVPNDPSMNRGVSEMSTSQSVLFERRYKSFPL